MCIKLFLYFALCMYVRITYVSAREDVKQQQTSNVMITFGGMVLASSLV